MFKLLAREIALHHGLLLTFMGKPFGDRGGSGLHVNMSMRNKRGSNAFADPKGEHGLSTVARQSIAGLIAHHEGMSAICAPTVNAYKRLRPGQLSGYWATWGKDHRSCTVRVPGERGEATRLEHRMPDGAANPYLATAAVLQAARLGVLSKATPPGPETLDGFEQASTDRHTPENLSLALDALEADTEFCEAFGRRGHRPLRLHQAPRVGEVRRRRHRLGAHALPAVPVAVGSADGADEWTDEREKQSGGRTARPPPCRSASTARGAHPGASAVRPPLLSRFPLQGETYAAARRSARGSGPDEPNDPLRAPPTETLVAPSGVNLIAARLRPGGERLPHCRA